MDRLRRIVKNRPERFIFGGIIAFFIARNIEFRLGYHALVMYILAALRWAFLLLVFVGIFYVCHEEEIERAIRIGLVLGYRLIAAMEGQPMQLRIQLGVNRQ